MNRWLAALLSALAIATAGCGGPTTYPVSGTVTCDGAPIAEGYIAFIPAMPGPGGGGAIVNGRYSVHAQPGQARVEITASKKITLPSGKTGPQGQTEEIRQYLPARYNANTELIKEVQAQKNSIDFELTTNERALLR